jgi:hypothetical protein
MNDAVTLQPRVDPIFYRLLLEVEREESKR